MHDRAPSPPASKDPPPRGHEAPTAGATATRPPTAGATATSHPPTAGGRPPRAPGRPAGSNAVLCAPAQPPLAPAGQASHGGGVSESPAAAGPALEIDLFSDVVCPWCFIGATRLERVLAERGLGATTAIRYRTFILDADVPDAGKDLRSDLARKYGRDPAPMFARVEAEARSSGIPLDLSRQPMFYPTVRAHTLLRAAGPKGSQRTLALALFRANFLDGTAISDPDVLAAIASEHGFTRDEARAVVIDAAGLALTRQEGALAPRLGINGVPFFVFDNKYAVAGVQPEAVLHRALDQVLGQASPPT